MRSRAFGREATTIRITSVADTSDAVAATNPGTLLLRAAQRTRLSRTKNGQVSLQAALQKSQVTSASSAQITPATTVVTSAAASASMPRTSARRIVTARAPKKSAELAARRTTKIGAARFELATSASQRQHSNQAELRPAVRRLHV